MAYENTSVPVAKSQEGIRKMLLQNKASGIAFVSQTEPLSEGFEAMIPIDGKTYRIRIVAQIQKLENHTKGRCYRGSYRAAKSDSQVQEIEMRRVWRVLYYHLKSVYEATNTGVMEFRELMLPYIVVKDGRTIAQHLLPQLDKAIESRPERMLGSGNL
jgi:hypothetical protein